VLRKTADWESLKSSVGNAIQFEKPKLKAVSRAECDKTDSEQFGSSSFDMPSLKQVQKAPTKGRDFLLIIFLNVSVGFGTLRI
jgi:hypothetical protein